MSIFSAHSHPRAREGTEWFASTFNQMSDIQQRQVGSLVGACIADAAAKGFDGVEGEDLSRMLREVEEEDAALTSPMGCAFYRSPHALASGRRAATPGAPPEPTVVSSTRLITTPPAPRRGGKAKSRLADHSVGYEFLLANMLALAGGKGTFDPALAQPHTAAVMSAYPILCRDAVINPGLFVACACLPAPVVYPYGSDDATRRQAMLMLMPLGREVVAAVDPLSRGIAMNMVSVLLRYLQRNPDPIKNASFFTYKEPTGRSAAQTGGGDALLGKLLDNIPPPADRRGILTGRVKLSASSSSSAAASNAKDPTLTLSGPRLEAYLGLPALPLCADLSHRTQSHAREVLTIAKLAPSFKTGVDWSIRLGGPACHRAMLVGALLGARFGARAIPPQWLQRQEADMSLVCSTAVEISQWSWNPAK